MVSRFVAALDWGLQVGAKDNLDGNLHPDPEKVEGFVTQEFDLDQLSVERLG
jgi:hypothetical protein